MKEVLLRQGTESASISKNRWNLLVPLMIVVTVCILLCCIIAQIQIYIMFINLQKEVHDNSIIIAKHKGNISSAHRPVRHSTETEHFKTYVSREILRFVPHHSRTKREGLDADDPARRRSQNGENHRQQANRNNGRRHHGQKREQGPKVTTVLHLELDGVDDIPFLQGDLITEWKLSGDAFNQDQDFATYDNGEVTVLKAGVYLIYSQVTFLDNNGRWSYSITIQEDYRREKPFIKCLSTEWGIEAGPDGSIATTFSQCYTAAVAFLKSGEIVRIKSMYDTAGIHTDHDMSFWGFVKLS